ncbi:unnamed protein product [Rotaria sordida]|uniref:LamG-like jellyroll fold domain-containing protein n=1 Tax=Rotaria sordida TaxID=392033 RepID=A0A814Y012_9BILA|nr:unnamed protein product [Rotaria sordida]CAF1223202.1 unnamed protein product [Rotaria sordida]CAF1231160.1 unnamed protein product [Rotaria sordida]CAF1275775.1 unnamed protein product [Rotaria sordida]CAF1503411.1 unnamed protein product [Rotaria sordida]
MDYTEKNNIYHDPYEGTEIKSNNYILEKLLNHGEREYECVQSDQLRSYYSLYIKPNIVPTSSNTTVSSCSSSTCIGQETAYRSSIVTALYPFDGNTNDQSGYYTGTGFGTSIPSYSTVAYISQSIVLSPNSQRYVQIPNINLSKESFTLQTWLRPGTINTSTDFVTSNEWTDVTVVYDATLYQQQIYVDGVSLSSTIIGRTSSLAYGTAYFQGRIDHFTITAGVARSSCQISNDASLIVYYPFDTTGTYNDYSVNLCNGYAYSTTIISSGRVNQAISFTSSTSYFESQCFPRMRGNEQSFSFSLWVNPNSTTSGGTLVHLSTNSNANGTCYDLLVFTSTGYLICQWMTTTPSVSSAQGPVIPAYTWTHIAVVYSSTNGVRLFINGQFSTSSSYAASLYLYNSNVPLYITLGNQSPLGSSAPLSCLSGSISISSGSFLGSIDEFRIYNRQLSNHEICVLANM